MVKAGPPEARADQRPDARRDRNKGFGRLRLPWGELGRWRRAVPVRRFRRESILSWRCSTGWRSSVTVPFRAVGKAEAVGIERHGGRALVAAFLLGLELDHRHDVIAHLHQLGDDFEHLIAAEAVLFDDTPIHQAKDNCGSAASSA